MTPLSALWPGLTPITCRHHGRYKLSKVNKTLNCHWLYDPKYSLNDTGKTPLDIQRNYLLQKVKLLCPGPQEFRHFKNDSWNAINPLSSSLLKEWRNLRSIESSLKSHSCCSCSDSDCSKGCNPFSKLGLDGHYNTEGRGRRASVV